MAVIVAVRAKHGQRFKHFQRFFCARKTCCKLLLNLAVTIELKMEDGMTLSRNL